MGARSSESGVGVRRTRMLADKHVLFSLFYGHSDHPALHSFPTRRSSDLLTPGRFELTSSISPVMRSKGEERGDRKSTRLNSSHTVISYAVFCLKKKNAAIIALNGPRETRLACAGEAHARSVARRWADDVS